MWCMVVLSLVRSSVQKAEPRIPPSELKGNLRFSIAVGHSIRSIGGNVSSYLTGELLLVLRNGHFCPREIRFV